MWRLISVLLTLMLFMVELIMKPNSKKKKKKIIPWSNANYLKTPNKSILGKKKKDENKLIDCIMRKPSFKLAVSTKRSHHLSNVCFFDSRFSSVQFSRSVTSDSLRPHESQHARPPCPSPTPGVYSNSCSLSRWCHSAKRVYPN